MSHFYPFLAYVLVTTFTPGPNNVMAMTNGLRYGYRGTLRFLSGMTSGFILVMLLSGFLNVALINLLPRIKPFLTWAGALYMLYLAVHILRSKPDGGGSPAKTSDNTFRAGLFMQFINLKGILYGITVYSLFIVPFSSDAVVVSLFAPVLAAIGFLAVSSWALGGEMFRRVISRNSTLFNLVMAGLLVYTAAASLLE